jgi:peptidoglycan L-alanyl-D-glutamate endopeptidase CwlK
VRRAITLTKQDFTVICGRRSKEEQIALYEQGRTKPGKIVTWTRTSRHITGHAVDLCAYVNGKISWNVKLYPAIVEAMEEAADQLGIPLRCGADFSNKDWGHFELPKDSYPS